MCVCVCEREKERKKIYSPCSVLRNARHTLKYLLRKPFDHCTVKNLTQVSNATAFRSASSCFRSLVVHQVSHSQNFSLSLSLALTLSLDLPHTLSTHAHPWTYTTHIFAHSCTRAHTLSLSRWTRTIMTMVNLVLCVLYNFPSLTWACESSSSYRRKLIQMCVSTFIEYL